MVTNTINEISEILLALFNGILDIGWYPQNWASSILCPIHTSGSKTVPNNFRGISWLDILNKILTGML